MMIIVDEGVGMGDVGFIMGVKVGIGVGVSVGVFFIGVVVVVFWIF